MKWSVIFDYMPFFMAGLATTAWLSASTFVVSTALGLVLAASRLSRAAVIRIPAIAVIEGLRAIPLLMLIFWVYFMIPAVLRVEVPALAAGFVALSAASAGYLAEIVRAGILAVPRGQWDASTASGLGYLQTMRHVVIPQALRKMVPPMVNQFVGHLKGTSLLYIIGITEFFRVATLVNNREFRSFEIFTLVALVYLALCAALSLCARLLERRLGQSEVQVAAI
jgi:polar amino acid transport system permease protein